VLHVAENGVEALALLGTVARNEVREARVQLVVQVAAEDLEVLGEWWLWALREVDLRWPQSASHQPQAYGLWLVA
jgi:hypothetical protein